MKIFPFFDEINEHLLSLMLQIDTNGKIVLLRIEAFILQHYNKHIYI